MTTNSWLSACRVWACFAAVLPTVLVTVLSLYRPTVLTSLDYSVYDTLVRAIPARVRIGRTELDLPPDFGRLPADIETTVFRFVQECLTNVHRHSGSSNALVSIQTTSGQVIVAVTDTGHGMPQSITDGGGESGAQFGVGLMGLLERVQQAGGNMQIQSNAQGTTVTATLPREGAGLEQDLAAARHGDRNDECHERGPNDRSTASHSRLQVAARARRHPYARIISTLLYGRKAPGPSVAVPVGRRPLATSTVAAKPARDNQNAEARTGMTSRTT